MIRSEREYRSTIEELAALNEEIELERRASRAEGFSEDVIEMAIAGMSNLRDELEFEVERYRRLKAGQLPRIQSVGELRRALIMARVAANLSQRELADRLGVTEAQISRDERHEYHGVSIKRAQTILEAMGFSFSGELHRREQPPVWPELDVSRCSPLDTEGAGGGGEHRYVPHPPGAMRREVAGLWRDEEQAPPPEGGACALAA